MSGVNKTILIGRLGKDPEVRFTKSGKAVCNFSLAVQERQDDDTEWFNITAWDKLGEICGEYLSKGSQIYVEGRRKTEKWDNDAGETQHKESIVIYNMTMLGQKEQPGPNSQSMRNDG